MKKFIVSKEKKARESNNSFIRPLSHELRVLIFCIVFSSGIVSILASSGGNGGNGGNGADSASPVTTTSPSGSTYMSDQLVTLTCDDGGGSGCTATYYTIDGSDPTTSSSVYSTDITISSTTTLKYFSVDNAGNAEVIKTETYTIISGPLSLSVTPLYPNNGTNWNDYVRSDGANRFVASDTVCDFTADTYYSSCIHGGEYRLAEIAGVTSCSGLTATDALDVFNWACDDSSGVARIISTGLKDNMHLSDLIDWSGTPPQWLANSVTVNNGTSDIATSSSTAWWSNPIVADNDGGSLAAAGTIYVVTSDPNADYTMDADKIGLVVQPGVTLHGAGTASSASVTANNRHHLWLEGVIDAGLFVGTAINWNPVHFSVLRNVTVVNAQDGIFFNQAPTGNLLSHILVSNAHNGLWLSTGRWNILQHVTVTNTRANGITAPQFSTLIDITAANNTDGVSMIFGSDNNILLDVTSVNNNNGITTSTAHRNTMMNLAAVNNNTGGIVTGSSDSNIFANLLATENSYGVQENNSNFNSFTGLLKVGNNNIFNCDSPFGGTPGLESVTCANAGSSDATLTTGVSAAASFVEKVTVDDTSNTSDTNGSAPYNSITDWASFDNPYRGWGKDSNDAFPNSLHALRCTTIDTCRIWDWSLANGDTGDGGSPALQDVLSLPSGDNTLTHTWQAPTAAAACNLIPGAVWNAGAGTCTSTLLRNAVEIIDDGLGNENGLCESNETCLFTPNIGSYQGHGDLITAGAFTGGTITGVTLLRYGTNGY
jgi:hypothetical protein